MMTEKELERFLAVVEVANLLAKHPQTIRKDIREGNLKAVRLGGRNSLRISVTEYHRYVAWLKEQGGEAY
jgi:excisionase family DNA binding protein